MTPTSRFEGPIACPFVQRQPAWTGSSLGAPYGIDGNLSSTNLRPKQAYRGQARTAFSVALSGPLRHLPVLIIGDVHGDIERLSSALQPYPADEWRTIFLGDLVDYGSSGIACLRLARDRTNTDVLLGNHEVAMLSALGDASRVSFYMRIGGNYHDLDELRMDEELQDWLKARPLVLKLGDGTLVQHCGNDDYRLLLGEERSDPVGTINNHGRLVLEAGDAHLLWDVMSGTGVFATQPDRLERWLELTGSRRVVFGHTPHHEPTPAHYHGGRAINYDGGLSRAHYRRAAPIAASVGPLPP